MATRRFQAYSLSPSGVTASAHSTHKRSRNRPLTSQPDDLCNTGSDDGVWREMRDDTWCI
jgi:hypothetical protein